MSRSAFAYVLRTATHLGVANDVDVTDGPFVVVGPQLESMLSDLNDVKDVVASWLTSIPFSIFSAPLLEKIDEFSMELVQAETFLSDTQASQLLDIDPLLHQKQQLWDQTLCRFQTIKENHMPLIENLLQRAKDEASAEKAEESQEKEAKKQKVKAAEEVSSDDEEVEQKPQVNKESSFAGEDPKEDAKPGSQPLEPPNDTLSFVESERAQL